MNSATATAGTDALASQYNNLRKDLITQAGEYVVSTGSANAYVLAVDAQIAAYVAGQVFIFNANFANTSAATINVNTLGAKTIKKFHDQDLEANDIESGQVVVVQYDGTNMQMLSQVPTKYYVGDLGQTADDAAVLTTTQDKSLSVDLGFVPKHFSAFISGDAASSVQFDYGSNAGVCRQSAKIDGIIGGAVAYLYIQNDGASLIPNASPILNPMMGTVTSPTSESAYLGTFGTGTTASPGLPSQTPSSSSSSIVFKEVTVSGTTITFTWTFTKGDTDCGVRIGVHQLACSA